MRHHLLLGLLVLVACTPGASNTDTASFRVPPTNEIRIGSYEAPTPSEVSGARTVSTSELRSLLAAPPPPVLIDVLDGVDASIPGAMLLAGAGQGTGLNDDVQRRLGVKLAALTRNDRTRPVVFFCLSHTCWLSHNAAVRAVAAGYTNVLWYRGGRTAWLEAGLPLTPVRPASW